VNNLIAGQGVAGSNPAVPTNISRREKALNGWLPTGILLIDQVVVGNGRKWLESYLAKWALHGHCLDLTRYYGLCNFIQDEEKE